MSSVSRILTAIRPSLTSSAAAVRTYTTSTTESAAAAAPGYYKVTQTRSLIGVPKSTIKVLKSLGLGRRIGRPVFQPHNPAAAGKILKVKELVKVENMLGPIPAEGYQRTRATKGYKVVGKMF
ncbi:large subunit ribosomal protein L30 [Entomortierella parvispora]|uniref:Large ribosomal subunit protein uL30m n=1 Tax=Entomortierella parvispora TaxID=205924 RepID=A0A9P3HL08_9FUNG|nr:large subunit ribosomal protein L30 [Entomortierella parvispora]